MIRLEEIDSTSSHARRAALAGELPGLPCLIRADRQTAGRGRGSHAWWSAPGSLLFTLVLDPAQHGIRADHEPRMALVAALALIEAIGPCRPGWSPGIRWPNDVEAGGRKLAGLLPERVETKWGPRFLLGIGVNVTTRLDEAPAEIRRMATSVAEIRGGPAGADEVLRGFLACLGPNLAALAADEPTLADRWNRHDLLGGKRVVVALAGRRLEGIGRGMDELGGLRLDRDGVVETLYGGQVLRDLDDPAPPEKAGPPAP